MLAYSFSIPGKRPPTRSSHRQFITIYQRSNHGDDRPNLDLDAFVSETIGLDDVEAAFAKMKTGEVLRSVVVL